MNSSVKFLQQVGRRRWLAVLVTAFALLLACAGPAAAQKDKKKKKPDTEHTDTGKPMIPMADEPQIDYMISDMLGAWQLGNIEKLHQDYADDVSVVSGIWTPPIIGWTNYLAVYQQQRARMQQVRLERTNTYIKVNGNFAWACYQWDFSGTLDGQPSAAQGQTTLVLEKRNNRWIIVHNHTSIAQPGQPQASPPASPAGTQPATPGPAAKPPDR
jgi:ketosteroid isomerase-like protein